MPSALLPTTEEIRAIALEELTLAGGTVSDCFDDGTRLFLRSVLPLADKVRPKDVVRGGVALMTIDEEIRVHPYTFREVCRNGAIMAQATQTRSVLRVGLDAPAETIVEVGSDLREAVRACCAPEAFRTAVGQMRSAMEGQADLALHLLPWLSRMPQSHAARLLAEIEHRVTQDGDRSAFGLMNAVTSVARDQRDPEVRWRLEELGGAIPALVAPVGKPGGAAARLVGAGRL